ncbi:hypothetical protein M407DRAFT_204167 [Tulasnella calospora MUT 4182]|uniref:Uncharacterized protein n=1 Tax=Tulasnella calospora MUT 4182 TaxID=1051891 RepID=A0A0C3Q8F5_9AGAM|nr:hypothetical protein M407DRAFT_204167 [Tulasnella calospora MUT 4182]
MARNHTVLGAGGTGGRRTVSIYSKGACDWRRLVLSVQICARDKVPRFKCKYQRGAQRRSGSAQYLDLMKRSDGPVFSATESINERTQTQKY